MRSPSHTMGRSLALVTEISVAGSTSVVAVAELLTGFGSMGCAVTDAVLTTVPRAVAVTVTVITRRSATGKSGTVQASELPSLVQAPRVVCSETSRNVAGRRSATTMFEATLGPRLLTTIEYANGWRTGTGSGASVIVSNRSAAGSTVLMF